MIRLTTIAEQKKLHKKINKNKSHTCFYKVDGKRHKVYRTREGLLFYLNEHYEAVWFWIDFGLAMLPNGEFVGGSDEYMVSGNVEEVVLIGEDTITHWYGKPLFFKNGHFIVDNHQLLKDLLERSDVDEKNIKVVYRRNKLFMNLARMDDE